MDNTVTLQKLETLTAEFLAILDKCPSRLKRKMLAGTGGPIPPKEAPARPTSGPSTVIVFQHALPDFI